MRFCGPAAVLVLGGIQQPLEQKPQKLPLKWIEYGVYRDLILITPKPYSIYLRGTINPKPSILVSIFFSIVPIEPLI